MDESERIKARLAGNVLGDEQYGELIGSLPNSFFREQASQRKSIWDRIILALTRGERDPKKLAKLAEGDHGRA